MWEVWTVTENLSQKRVFFRAVCDENSGMKDALLNRDEICKVQEDLLAEYFNQNSSTSFFWAGIIATYKVGMVIKY